MLRTLVGLGAVLAAVTSSPAAAPLPGELATAGQWFQDAFGDKRPDLPFSFSYGGRPSGDLLAAWTFERQARALGVDRREHRLTWTDRGTGLQVRCVAVEYDDFPVAEWTVWLKNTGSAKTPILQDIQGLDVAFQRAAGAEFVLHGNRGDWCVAESYQPFEITLDPSAVKRFSPPVNGEAVSGKSCDGPEGWPYFNLKRPGGGVILAVGWPGQWEASFARDAAQGLRVRAGQQLTRLALNPGEEIRTPLIALLFWQGADVVRAQNVWRRWYLAHVLPRIDGQAQPPVMSIQVEGSAANIPGVETYLRAGVRPDVCWRDAGGRRTWYPSVGGPHTGEMAWLNTGTWTPDPEKYPQGFKPFSDKVRALGMAFLLWFEPERVGDPDSWLGRNHPEWLLPGNSAGSVLNLGNPAALRWLVDHLDGLIKSQGIDWYREDLNGSRYATAWRNHDAADRQGATENFHVQGHLFLWDELRRRNPALRIDSCASGGRRNDLETMRRAVPLLRSDFQHSRMRGVMEGNQAHTYGLSSWLPWQGSGVYSIDPYAVRSFLLPGFDVIPPPDWSQSASGRAAVKRAYDEARRVAPLMFGDYYPLTPYSLADDAWIAWQFDRPDLGQGMVQAFRRAQCPSESLCLKLRGLDPRAAYEVENLDGGRHTRTGAELAEQGLRVQAPARPAALVFVYRRLPADGAAGRDGIYPRGRRLAFMGYSGDPARDLANGFTVAGPVYGDQRAYLDRCFKNGWPVVVHVGPAVTFNDKDPAKYKVDPENLRREVGRQVCELAGHEEIVWWAVRPEELRPWRRDEMEYLRIVAETVRKNDPLARPIYHYNPNHRDARSLAPIAEHVDVVAKGCYVNLAGRMRDRAWVRWSVEQEVEAIRAAGRPDATALVMPELCRDPDPELDKEIGAWVRHDVYLGLASGAKGVLIWSLFKRPQVNRTWRLWYDAYAECARELNGPRALAQVFLFGRRTAALQVRQVQGPAAASVTLGGAAEPLTTSDQERRQRQVDVPSWTAAEFEDQAARWLFLVNSANGPAAFDLNGWAAGEEAENAFTRAAVALPGDGRPMRLDLPAYGVVGLRFTRADAPGRGLPSGPRSERLSRSRLPGDQKEKCRWLLSGS